MNKPTSRGKLRALNDLLTATVIMVALYIIVLPFLPALTWWAKYEAPVVSQAPQAAVAEAKVKHNTLIMPSLALKERVYEGETLQTLKKGIWHLPWSSTPDKVGNTVLAGHRFTYDDPAVFYHLDKADVGDKITLFWKQQKYSYLIKQILVVSPSETWIEQPTKQPMLTIYTCTPLWTATNRLVIRAQLVESL